MRRFALGLSVVIATLTAVPSAADAGVARSAVGAKLPSLATGPKWSFNGTACNLISTKLATPVGLALGGCPGVRPGAYVQSVIGGCSFNFLFTSITENRTYAGTAGHCIVPENTPGEHTSFANPAANAYVNGALRHIGDFVYGRLDDQFDFGLIKLNALGDQYANAQMCHFGGPTGLRRGSVAFGEVLQQYGNGLAIGEVVPGRSHVAIFSDQHGLMSAGFGAVGDSGSGLTDASGRATAVLVAGLSYAGPVTYSSRLDTHLDRAAARLGLQFAVMTAPTL